MKIAVAVPPVLDFYFTPHRFSGLGGEILQHLLQENGCHTRLFNFPAQKKKGCQVPLPRFLDYLKPHLTGNETGRLSFFTRYQHFGPVFSSCAHQIIEYDPDLVFISCFAFCYGDAALEFAARIRALRPDIPIVIGGAGISAYPEYFIKDPNIDVAVSGEAEVSVPLLIHALKTHPKNLVHVPNLYLKKNGRITAPKTQKITDANDIVFVLKQTNQTPKTMSLTTSLSRGCIKNCRFCSNFLSHGRNFRVIPEEKIQNALASLSLSAVDRDKPVSINFEDDNLLLAPEYFFNVLQLFKKKFPRVSFLAENGLDYTKLSPERVKKLIDFGFTQFNLSIASTHMPILEKEHRETALPRYEKIVRMLDQHEIPCITYFICGFKKDSSQTVAATIAYLARQPTRIGISMFYPVPGIPDYTDKPIFDKIPAALCAGASAFPWNQSLSTAQLVTAFRLCRFVNLFKEKTKSREEKMLIQKILNEQKLYTVIRKNGIRSIVPVPHADADMVQLFFDYFSPPT